MKHSMLLAALIATTGLAACDRTTVVPVPVSVPVPVPVAVPGPAGPQGEPGNTGATGKPADTTVIVVAPAASAPTN